MTETPRRMATIGVAPYADGSGFAATVRAYTDESGEPVFEVSTVWRLEAKFWPELREAIESALALVAART